MSDMQLEQYDHAAHHKSHVVDCRCCDHENYLAHDTVADVDCSLCQSVIVDGDVSVWSVGADGERFAAETNGGNTMNLSDAERQRPAVLVHVAVPCTPAGWAVIAPNGKWQWFSTEHEARRRAARLNEQS